MAMVKLRRQPLKKAALAVEGNASGATMSYHSQWLLYCLDHRGVYLVEAYTLMVVTSSLEEAMAKAVRSPVAVTRVAVKAAARVKRSLAMEGAIQEGMME